MPFIPADAKTSAINEERIAIIGPPGAGKTTSLLTFPNLVVLDRDKKLPPGIISIPAWNPDWADEMIGGKKKRTISNVPNFRDAIKIWLRNNHDKFEPEQTFAMDSWTFIQDACDLETHAEDDLLAPTKSGERNAFYFWGQKLRYSKELMDFIKSMKCRVVVTLHETIDRDEKGNVNGKIRPVQDGSYKDQLLGGFTDVWRMRGNVVKNPSASGLAARNADGTKKEVERGYYWQLTGDSVVDLNTNPTLGRIIKKRGLSLIEVIQDNATGVVSGGYQTIQKLYAEEGVIAAKTQTQ